MVEPPELEREIFLACWKVHILHHAGVEPVVGQWMLRELRRHGYEVSPGTLYPILGRMEERGWLRCVADPGGGPRARKEYTLTRKGRSVLRIVQHRLQELYREVVLEAGDILPDAPRRRKGANDGRRRAAARPGRGPH